ncbi:hypothetical protein DPMN_158413 [Dreissena polymorpha]|uniref:Uncharacterized protein n=1 Tax=Dreissena polymorpha TaxID=45954 RepID=A0A9D4EIZ8_DREPO|nr:hypothetical protein DPMN_158413 [Dreissena polymorpha]
MVSGVNGANGQNVPQRAGREHDLGRDGAILLNQQMAGMSVEVPSMKQLDATIVNALYASL